jgi:DNA-binding GntR family transcriptional regulator
MSGPSAFEDYRRADIRFHIGVAEAAHSPHLVTEMTEVQAHMSELIARIPHPEEVLTRSNNQHRELVGLLQKHNGDKAVTLMRRHIEGTEHILAGLI